VYLVIQQVRLRHSTALMATLFHLLSSASIFNSSQLSPSIRSSSKWILLFLHDFCLPPNPKLSTSDHLQYHKLHPIHLLFLFTLAAVVTQWSERTSATNNRSAYRT